MRMNRIFIAGNITRDIELNTTKDGKPVCKFSIGVNNANETFFLKCEAWDKLAETTAGNCKKGMLVVVEGRLKENKWTKDGVEKVEFIVVCNNVQWVSKKTEDHPF